MKNIPKITRAFLIGVTLLMPHVASAENLKITRLACDALVTETYPNGQKDQSREKFTLVIETYSNGYTVFGAETPKVFISMPSRGKKGVAEVIDNSSPEVWRYNLSATIKGRPVSSSLKLDRVTGEFYYQQFSVITTDIAGFCEKTDAGHRKF